MGGRFRFPFQLGKGFKLGLWVYVLIRAQNVSVVDLQTNKVIGAPVKRWDVWPDDVSGGGDDGMYCAPLVSC